MRMHALLAISMVLKSSTFAASPKVMSITDAVRSHLLVTAPAPNYPFEARLHHVTGRGVYELRFDYETGRLLEVHVVKSIGSDLLDGRTIGALKLWRAKPRSVYVIRVPITFTMTRPR